MREFFKNRFNILGILVGILLFVLIIQIINLQVIKGKYYAAVAQSRGYSSKVIDAPRGEIVDKYGRVIATNKIVSVVTIEDKGLENSELNGALYNLL
ncbi:MAG: penicillin-binding protein 2, partial [Bacillota bacterium]|nr:penicillin-binding protein 2 [Bacillota bacterium]